MRRWMLRGACACAFGMFGGCSSQKSDAESLREALARLPQDTAPQRQEEMVHDTASLDSSGSGALPDSAGFFDPAAAAPIERDTTPVRLTPGPPSDTRPWIPEAGAPLLTRDWTVDAQVGEGEGGRMTTLESVRTARNDGFDRVVFEFQDGRVPGYRIEYVDPPVRQCGSGQPVSLRGNAWLRVRIEPSQAHDERGRPTVQDRTRTADLPVLGELRLICDYEGQVEWVLGVASANPFRVTRLNSPARLVVDVSH